ncbi:hypothetical protein BBJ28_00020434 [Nothophytophthora sp. Chile5]|nr:hypothetical protein BBJ28_00020434 [Nothophytophthora sp. Chile5]
MFPGRVACRARTLRPVFVCHEISSVLTMRLELLPVDVIDGVCGFLLGLDAFHLSHVNGWWFRLLSDGSFWHQRLLYGSIPEAQQHLLHTWKRRYVQARSMRFHGLRTDDDDHLSQASYSCVEYPPPTDWGQFRRMHFALRTLHEESFSFDVWFCLQPGSSGQNGERYAGGIIYGLQSDERDSGNWPHFHQQFVVVDSKCNLYCSVLDFKKVVAHNLKFHRWYHLLLTYDHACQRQNVYVDGANVWSETGALHREWGHLHHEQVGTGCVTAGNGDFPHPNYFGWYGFCGILDEFRFWTGALPTEDACHLANGGTLSDERLLGSMKYPGLRGPRSRINVQLVPCTRPAEGRSVEVAKCHLAPHTAARVRSVSRRAHRRFRAAFA